MDLAPGLSGRVTLDGVSLSSYPETHTIKDGSYVTFEAMSALGFRFDSWSGDITGSENPAEVRVYHNMIITAHFLPHIKELISEDEILKATIPEGTDALDIWGDPLTELNFFIDETPPPPPETASIIGCAYRLEPDGATFDPPVSLTWSYEPTYIPNTASEESLAIAYYDEDAGEWIGLPSNTNMETHQVTANMEHLTTFALMGFPPPPKPAEFVLTSLSIHPEEADTAETVFITALINNIGELDGKHTVNLKIDDAIEKTKEMTVAGGTERAVVFTTSRVNAGSYLVDVNGLKGSFTVKEPPAPNITAEVPTTPEPSEPSTASWWLIAIILAAVAVAIAVPLARRRRRNSRHEA